MFNYIQFLKRMCRLNNSSSHNYSLTEEFLNYCYKSEGFAINYLVKSKCCAELHPINLSPL